MRCYAFHALLCILCIVMHFHALGVYRASGSGDVGGIGSGYIERQGRGMSEE